MTLFCSSSMLQKTLCLYRHTKDKKRGFCFFCKNWTGNKIKAGCSGMIGRSIDHQTQGIRAFGFAETSMFRCRLESAVLLPAG